MGVSGFRAKTANIGFLGFLLAILWTKHAQIQVFLVFMDLERMNTPRKTNKIRV